MTVKRRRDAPDDKPRVERSVPYVRERFFKGAEFRDLADMRSAARRWCRVALSARFDICRGERCSLPVVRVIRAGVPVERSVPFSPLLELAYRRNALLTRCQDRSHCDPSHRLEADPLQPLDLPALVLGGSVQSGV